MRSNIPFNHISNDNEFYWSLYSFFHLNQNVDIDNFQNLRVNPFDLNDIERPISFDHEPELESELSHHVNCDYTFSKNLKSKVDCHSDDCFSLLHLNIRSLRKNFDEFQTLLTTASVKFTAIGITETWCNENTPTELYNIDNYAYTHICRETTGGGVGLYVSNDVDFSIRHELCCTTPELEALFVEVHDTKSIIGCVYRPPNISISVFQEKLESILEVIDNEKRDVYIMGDYNIDLLNCSTHASTSTFLDNMYSHSLYPIITKPTRVSANSATLIDNIFTNVHSRLDSITAGVIYSDMSDHFPVFGVFKKKNSQTSKTSKLNIKENMKRLITDRSITDFKAKLVTIDWTPMYVNQNANDSYEYFVNRFSELYNQCFPLVACRKRNKTKQPWISNGILKSIRKKNKLYKTYLKIKTEKCKKKYLLYKNKLTHILRVAKKQYFIKLFSDLKGNMKKTWEQINSILGKTKKSTMISEIVYDNRKLKSNRHIANAFNTYFVNIGKNLAKSIPSMPGEFQG